MRSRLVVHGCWSVRASGGDARALGAVPSCLSANLLGATSRRARRRTRWRCSGRALALRRHGRPVKLGAAAALSNNIAQSQGARRTWASQKRSFAAQWPHRRVDGAWWAIWTGARRGQGSSGGLRRIKRGESDDSATAAEQATDGRRVPAALDACKFSGDETLSRRITGR